MQRVNGPFRMARHAKTSWVKYVLIALIFENIVQHVVVTIALYFNWADIRSTVAVHPSILMVLGTVVAVVYGLSLWGIVAERKWATSLVIALALFDIIGEFAAQGTISIVFNVSFIVAIVLLILALLYRRQASNRAM